MNLKECPIVRTLEVIGGKWKPIILHYLSEAPRRTGELGRLIPQASGKMLTQQLRELEADRIIRRKVYRQVPPKVEYILTPLGESLRPVMVAMCAWGQTYAHRDNGKGSQGPSLDQALARKRLTSKSS
jgi:DNA-binding HxlR family transcriptional regulator